MTEGEGKETIRETSQHFVTNCACQDRGQRRRGGDDTLVPSCMQTSTAGRWIGKQAGAVLLPVFFPISLSDLSLGQAGQALFCFVFAVYVPIRSPSFTWRPRVHLSYSGEDRVEDTVEGTPTRTRTQLHLFHCLAHAHVYPSLSACRCTGLSYRTANMKAKTHPVRYSARHICGFPPDAPRAQYGCMTGDPRIWVHRGSLIAVQGGWGSHSLTTSLPATATTATTRPRLPTTCCGARPLTYHLLVSSFLAPAFAFALALALGPHSRFSPLRA